MKRPRLALLLPLLILLGSSLNAVWASAEPPLAKPEMVAGPFRSMPAPDYPIEARRQGLAGSGMYVLHIDPATGRVKAVTVQQSTGHRILDNACIAAFIQWRFKPHTVAAVRMPAKFTIDRP